MAGQERNIARQETLIQSIDPALLDAGKQMKQLLDGQAAPVLDQMKNQRLTQRNQMIDNLRQQMGPGAETSSMGQNMMMKFDAETANMLSGAQQQYLDKVSNLALGGGKTLTDTMSEAQKTLSAFGQQLGDIGRTKAGLIMGGTEALNAPMAAQTNAAGGQYKGDMIMGQMYGQLGGALIQGAGAYAGAQSKAGGAQPNTLGNSVSSENGLPTNDDYYNAYRSNDPYDQYMGGSNSGVKSMGTYGGGGGISGGGTTPYGPFSSGYSPAAQPITGQLSTSVMQGTGIAMPDYINSPRLGRSNQLSAEGFN